jgi:phosphoribosylanthranilate isomerase
MRIKICGITQPEQGKAIASLGATALGFMCVASSGRYVTPEQIKAVMAKLPENVDKIGVFANASLDEITQIVIDCGLTGVQLHGDESPEFCDKIRQALPQIEILKALRIKNHEQLSQATHYSQRVDALLLDAYHAQQLGGTGITLDWQMLQEFSPNCPWFLAGGLTPDNILEALSQVNPDGIDLSSGVEFSPGNKDLDKVASLFERLGNVGV